MECKCNAKNWRMWRRGEGVVNEMEREEITGGITEFQGKG
jgi:hypothetical protein